LLTSAADNPGYDLPQIQPFSTPQTNGLLRRSAKLTKKSHPRRY